MGPGIHQQNGQLHSWVACLQNDATEEWSWPRMWMWLKASIWKECLAIQPAWNCLLPLVSFRGLSFSHILGKWSLGISSQENVSKKHLNLTNLPPSRNCTHVRHVTLKPQSPVFQDSRYLQRSYPIDYKRLILNTLFSQSAQASFQRLKLTPPLMPNCKKFCGASTPSASRAR